MNNRMYIGLTTYPQDGLFLVVGHDLDMDFPVACLLPQAEQDTIRLGDVVQIDLRGPKKNIDGSFYPCATLIEVEQRTLSRQQAMDLQDKVNEFLQLAGWTEDVESDIEELLRERDAFFNIFPD